MNAIDTPVVGVEVEGRAFALHAPARPEVEVRAAVARSESHCGYGAALWPMARVLAAHVLRSPIVGPGLRVLEIGCGLGLVSLAAAARGPGRRSTG